MGADNAQTVEGTRLQLDEGEYSTNAVVVSTLMEAWEVVQGGLVKDGTVKDVELFRMRCALLTGVRSRFSTAFRSQSIRLQISQISGMKSRSTEL